MSYAMEVALISAATAAVLIMIGAGFVALLMLIADKDKM